MSRLCALPSPKTRSRLRRLSPSVRVSNWFPLRKWRAVANSARGLFGQTPLQIQYHVDPAMRRTIQRVVEETQPDLLYSHYIRMGNYVEPYRHVPRVLAMQLSMTLNYRRLAEHAATPIHKAVYGLEYRRLQRFEAEFAAQV